MRAATTLPGDSTATVLYALGGCHETPFAFPCFGDRPTSLHRIAPLIQVERQSRALDKKAVKLQAQLREEAKEGLKRDALESREALGLVPTGEGEGEDGEAGDNEEEAAPPQVLKERIESVVEVLSDFQVGWRGCMEQRRGPVGCGVEVWKSVEDVLVRCRSCSTSRQVPRVR